jgi:hypothetical protein
VCDHRERVRGAGRQLAQPARDSAGSKTAALALAYKLLESAQQRWRRFNGHELVADVLNDVKFKDGIKVTDDDNHDDGMSDERVAA